MDSDGQGPWLNSPAFTVRLLAAGTLTGGA